MSSLNWIGFEGGASLGQPGSESGVILVDEEHEEGARITLERDSPTAPYAITCGVYGWMFHTRYFGSEKEARSEYEQMKVGLAEIASAVPYKDDSELEDNRRRVIDLIGRFVEQFP